MGLDFAIGAFATLFAIINPIANVPIIEEITGDFTKDLKKRVVLNIFMVMVVTLLTFGLLGNWIFSIYGITIHTFKVAGGVLLFYISFSMVQGEWSRTKISKEEREEPSLEQLGIVPLGIPLHVGPGAITTVMILVSETISSGSLFDLISVFMIVPLVAVITYILLMNSSTISRLMGKSGTMAFTRIMGILLAAVGIHFIYTGTIQFLIGAGVL